MGQLKLPNIRRISMWEQRIEFEAASSQGVRAHDHSQAYQGYIDMWMDTIYKDPLGQTLYNDRDRALKLSSSTGGITCTSQYVWGYHGRSHATLLLACRLHKTELQLVWYSPCGLDSEHMRCVG